KSLIVKRRTVWKADAANGLARERLHCRALGVAAHPRARTPRPACPGRPIRGEVPDGQAAAHSHRHPARNPRRAPGNAMIELPVLADTTDALPAATPGAARGKLFIQTHGCQMNEYDSARMADVLAASDGLELTTNVEEADVVLVNTCSIREKAQEKVFSQLGRWRVLKESRLKA